MLGVLLRGYVSPFAGVLAAWLLALHPWHIRFTSEARGYSLLRCIIPIVPYFWIRAIRQNEWRWWLLYSGSQFALIYCYPGSLYVLIVLNGAMIFLRKRGLGFCFLIEVNRLATALKARR